MKEGKRKYSGPLQFFHNYEHDREGRKHCTGPASNPYRIKHANGRHEISHRFAKGHGKKRKTQWWEFNKRLGTGWDMASGKKVEEPSRKDKGK